MERNLPVELILIEEIAEAARYGTRFDYEDAALEGSLEKRGILFPLLLTRRLEEKAEVISGHRRLFYARRKPEKRVPVTFVEEEFSEKELFLLSLYSNWGQTFAELDRMETLLKAEKVFSFDREEIRQEICPALGIDEKGVSLEEYRGAGKLVCEIHGLIQKKRLPFRGASSLNRFSREEQGLLARQVFEGMHLTTNQLLLLSEWIDDLKRARKVSLETLLGEASFRKVLENCKPDPRTRGERFLRAVRTLRSPRLSEREESFDRLKERAKLPEEIQLERPESFEAEGILLRARLKNRESLVRLLRFLEDQGPFLNSFLE